MNYLANNFLFQKLKEGEKFPLISFLEVHLQAFFLFEQEKPKVPMTARPF